MKRSYLFIVFLLLFNRCNNKQASHADKLRPQCEEFVAVTFTKLISNPSLYHNKKIRIKGYFNFSVENVAIYEHRFSENGIWIDFDESLKIYYKKLHGTTIEVIGIFDTEHHGHLMGYLGEMKVLCLS